MPSRRLLPRHRGRLSALAIAILGAALLSGTLVVPAIAGAPVDYPEADAGYHSYAELRDEILALEAAHEDILDISSIGESVEGRPIYIAKISDDVDGPVQAGEAEVLFDGMHHAREHLTVEMTLHLLHLLVGRYGEDGELAERVTAIVDGRVTWIVFMLNPDGWVYDLTAPAAKRVYGPDGEDFYAGWRKNRSDLDGTDAMGIDLNRNYDYRWGCCGGSSGSPYALTYRGPAPWTAPEVRALRDFVNGRVIDGRQRITAHITFHTSGEEILYPYGYTRTDVPSDMTLLDHRTFVALAGAMAERNGYTPKQSSGLYVTDGDQIDWMYGRHRIFSFTFEMYPTSRQMPGTDRFYPPDERIEEETRRNRDAVLHLLETADCPYRAIGAAALWCGPLFDDLEIDRGWTVDPDGTDDATAGRWARGVPAGSSHQLASAPSGRSVLVTGRAHDVDVDGGTTTVRSPLFRLPDGKTSTLRLRYWIGLSAAAGSADGFTVRLVDDAGAAIGAPLLRMTGTGAMQRPAWRTLTVTLPGTAAGTRVAIELSARDDVADGGATVEAGVDTVRVTAR